MMRIARFLLPLFLLALAGGCSKSSNHASDPGTAPSITTQPLDANTVAGRPVTLSVTVAGAPVLRFRWAKDGVDILGALSSTLTLFDPQPADTGHYAVTITNPNGTLTSRSAALVVAPALSFTSPLGIVADSAGNLYVSDRDDHVIWKVDASNHVILLAGIQGLPGSVDTAPGITAQFRNPGGLALDASGNLLVADTGNSTLRKVALDGTVTTLAGAPGIPGFTNAVGNLARFNAPCGLAALSTGGVYIADSQNHTIRFMATDGTVSTYAGVNGQPGHLDAGGTTALFDQPSGLALAADGTLYVTDYGSSCIRAISPGNQVSTLAGIPNTPANVNGAGTLAQFNLPLGISLDAGGNLWVADTNNHAIRKVTSTGTVTTLAGSGAAGNTDSTGLSALFNRPCGIAFNPSGNGVVTDLNNHMLRQVTATGLVTTL